jgi:hypothetical protein
MRQERILVLILRLLGGLMLLAFVAVLLPADRMAEIHAALGLGALPQAPIVDYLARSLSLLYGLGGGLLFVVARDLRRHRPIARYLGWVNVVFGVVVLGIDLAAGMPAYWTWGEGPPIVATGWVLLYLLRSVPDGQKTA